MEITTIREVLKYLDKLGWSSVIDSRWENEVISDIKAKFPDISLSTLQEVLRIVLC